MSNRRPIWRNKAAIIITATILATSGAVGTATYAQNDIVGEWNHFANCFGLMINNTPEQVRECDPKVRDISTTNPSLSTQSPAGPKPSGPVSSGGSPS